jgi:hypothetical protein
MTLVNLEEFVEIGDIEYLAHRLVGVAQQDLFAAGFRPLSYQHQQSQGGTINVIHTGKIDSDGSNAFIFQYRGIGRPELTLCMEVESAIQSDRCDATCYRDINQ